MNLIQLDSYQDFIHAAIVRVEKGQRRKSLRYWAKQLGYKSPRSLGMVLKAQRFPSQQMLSRLPSVLKLTSEEFLHINELVAKQRNKCKETASEPHMEMRDMLRYAVRI